MLSKEVIDRFWNKVLKGKGCWEWQAGKRQGYGAMKVGNKLKAAHRLSWEIHHREPPGEMFVCHKCDNRGCVNPDHLFLGTHSDNMKDAFKKGRLSLPITNFFREGHYPPSTKIPYDKAVAVKSAVLSRRTKTLKAVALEHDVPYQYVRDISCGRILKNIASPIEAPVG